MKQDPTGLASRNILHIRRIAGKAIQHIVAIQMLQALYHGLLDVVF